MNNHWRAFVSPLLLLTLVSCTTISPVSPAGKDTYLVSIEKRGGMDSWGELKADTLKQADDYCEKLNKKMTPVKIDTHGARGWTPMQVEVIFSCLLINDADYKRPTLEPASQPIP